MNKLRFFDGEKWHVPQHLTRVPVDAKRGQSVAVRRCGCQPDLISVDNWRGPTASVDRRFPCHPVGFAPLHGKSNGGRGAIAPGAAKLGPIHVISRLKDKHSQGITQHGGRPAIHRLGLSCPASHGKPGRTKGQSLSSPNVGRCKLLKPGNADEIPVREATNRPPRKITSRRCRQWFHRPSRFEGSALPSVQGCP